MMRKQVIATLYLNKDARKIFSNRLKEVCEDAEVVHFSNIKQFLEGVQNEMILFYGYHTSAEELESDLEKLHSFNSFLPINIIFNKQNYQALAKAFHFNINHILNKKYNAEDIRRALLKCELKLMTQNEKSLKALQYLLETPIKIKNDLQMFQYLKNYFKQIDACDNFLMLKKSKINIKYLFGDKKIDNENIHREIKRLNIPDKAIGNVYELKKVGINVFPIYVEEGEIILGVTELVENSSLVFNDLFFKFLQNVHLYRKLKEKTNEMTELANTDDVTGLFNQRKLATDLDEIIKEHSQENKHFSVMFIDIDHFKVVNDLYGHIVGSQMLINIGNVLRQLLRDSDSIYRYGGDEFVVIMTDVEIDSVHKVALRILNSIKDMDFHIDNGDIHKLSLSIGIAEYPTNAKTAKDLIHFADEMMYESKKSGRGKVFHLQEVANARSGSK